MAVVTHTAALPRWQRPLLAASLLDGPDGHRRSPRDWAVDLVLFVLAAGLGLYVLTSGWTEHPAWAAAADITLGVAACAALWVRRDRPVEVGVAVTLASAVSGLANGAVLPAVFNAAVRAPLQRLALIGVLATTTTAVFPLLYTGGPDSRGYVWQLTFGLSLNAIALAAGVIVRAQRELLSSLRERALRAEADQHRRLLAARDAERRRIASEMHDTLAHRLSLLSVHAGAMERWSDQVPAPLIETAGVIRTNATAALAELRDVIGLLREPERVANHTPHLGNLPALLDDSRAAGLRIRSRIDLPAGVEPPAAVGRSAYRTVQEGLTNARKHGGGGRVDVQVEVRGGTLVAQVLSHRPLRPAPLTDEARLGTGTGLLGLAERLELAGGALTYGPQANGDFVVCARLPWTVA